MEQDDIELLICYQCDGDESAFSRLVERHSRWIYNAARRRLGDDHLADDGTQAVFVVLATTASQLVVSKRGSLSAWLFHVVHFTCARIARSQSRQVQLQESVGTERAKHHGDAFLADGRLLLLIEDSIAQLPAVEREIVVRRFYRRQHFAEIGQSLGISADAARKRGSRALDELRQIMLRDGIDAIPDTFLVNLNKPAGRRRAARQMTNSRQLSSDVKRKVTNIMIEQSKLSQGGFQMISAEFLVREVEANLEFFEKLGFPRRWVDTPDATGSIPRASLTAGHLGKIWIRRAPEAEIHPSASINVFFWIDGGPEGLIAHRRKIADSGVPVTPIIDEHALPNFNVTTPDGYSIAFFTAYVPAGQPPVVLVL